MTTRTAPPTRRSTCALGVSQSCWPWNQRRITSSLVQASKTAWAGAWKTRSMSSVSPLIGPGPVGVAGAQRSRPAPPPTPCRDRPARAGTPPGARLPRERVGSRARAPRAALGVGEARTGRLVDGRLVVLVVEVPPQIGLGLRVALGRVLPLLLAAERGDVEIGPGAAQRLVAALVDEVRAEDPVVVIAVEGVGAVPLVNAEVGVEVVGDRVPGNVPAHPRLPALDVDLRGARDVRERGVARVQMSEVRDLVGHERATAAAALGPAGYAGLEEVAVDDQLTAPVEKVKQARRPVWALKAVILLYGHPRHPAALGGQRVAGAGEHPLLDQQFLAGGLPLLRRDDRWHLHFGSFSFRYPSTTSNRRPQRARWRSIQSAASSSTSGSSESRCVRPSITRVTTPVSSRTFRCLEIAGLDTPQPPVTSPTVAGPIASRSTIPRRIGCESALNELLTIW